MNDIIPPLEKRITNLRELKRKIEMEGDHKQQAGEVITISREFGCEAYQLASALKIELEKFTGQHWTIFTEGAIEQTSSDSILSANLPEDFGEQSRYLEAVISSLFPNWQTEEEYYREVVKTIVAIAHRGHAILVGRGASAITRDLSNCYHFRLIGNKEFRAKTYADRHDVSLAEAEKIVVEKEKLRKQFLGRFLGTHFNLYNFHLIFNNEKVSVDKISNMIVNYIYKQN